jgi:hypothetical protein
MEIALAVDVRCGADYAASGASNPINPKTLAGECLSNHLIHD